MHGACMQNLSRRGLHGTALEYAKLLLGLDPTDPRGVLFCIDYLAIRAGQYSFLQVKLRLCIVQAQLRSWKPWQTVCCVIALHILPGKPEENNQSKFHTHHRVLL